MTRLWIFKSDISLFRVQFHSKDFKCRLILNVVTKTKKRRKLYTITPRIGDRITSTELPFRSLPISKINFRSLNFSTNISLYYVKYDLLYISVQYRSFQKHCNVPPMLQQCYRRSLCYIWVCEMTTSIQNNLLAKI